MSSITQSARRGDFIVSLANRTRSLDNATLATPKKIESGTVLGKVTASGKFVPLDPAASTGEQTAAGVALAAYDATAADVAIVVVSRDAELKSEGLIWPVGITDVQKKAAAATLLSAGITLAPR